MSVLGDGSECDVSGREQCNITLTSSGSSSSSSSLSDSDSDALMVSQELRPGFSSDKDVSSGGGRSVKDDRNRNVPDARSELSQQNDFAVDSNGQLACHYVQ